MKIFADANVLVSVINREYPSYSFTARVLSLAGKQHQVITSAVCLAIAWYFAEKKHGTAKAREKFNILLKHITVAECGKKETLSAIGNKKIHDFEDGLQYYAAVNAGCSVIVTDNTEDFYFAEINVATPEQFLLDLNASK